MSHTPGPWRAMQYTDNPERGYVIGYLGEGVTGWGNVTQSIDDANLIAAAPDLFNAMPTVPYSGGRLVKVVAHYEDGSTQTIDGEIVTSAIAKAKGE